MIGTSYRDWSTEVIAFLSENLPRNDDGWEHMCSTAYQIGCEALSALGQATEVEWGAVPLSPAVQPVARPRWDDICVAVLELAAQQNKLRYRQSDGTVATAMTGWRVVGAPPPPEPNILAAYGMGPAHADQDTISVLSALGIVSGTFHWAACAETVLWRIQPRAWAIDIRADPRFLTAVEHALHNMPSTLRAKISNIVVVEGPDIEHCIRQHQRSVEESRLRFGPNARQLKPMTKEAAYRRVHFSRCNDLDWIFFRNWRLSGGWLTPDPRSATLEIFHDRLAIQVRQAVLARLFPDLPAFSK